MADKESVEVIADRVAKLACSRCGHHMDVSALPMFTQFACPECRTQQMVPGRLGTFLLLERLGSGGMGAVYRALDTTLGREVAIKIMHRSLGADQQFVDNFLREARAAAAINHPNVVQIFSFGQEKGQPYLVMELVNGGRLDNLINTNQPVSEAKALALAVDVAQGLQAAQSQGLMHGDIKPANILFDRAGVAKVVDFGLASFIRQQKSVSKEIWGTPFYLAPEKARRQKADHRADIYSLGATLYHALTIQPPFDGETATQVVLARLQGPPPDIGQQRPDLQPITTRIITRMLAPDPFLRYPNYASLLADLQEAQEAVRNAPPVRPAPVAAAGRKSHLVLWLVVVCIVLGALVAMALLWKAYSALPVRRPGPPQTAPPPPAAVQPPPVAPPATAHAAVNPFSAREAALLTAAVAPLASGEVNRVVERLTALQNQPLTNAGQRAWLRLFRGLVLSAANRPAAADKELQELDPQRPAPTDADRLPRMFAGFLLGKSPAPQLAAELAREPPWANDLSHFILGLEHLRRTQPGAAAAQFAAYRPPAPNAPAWPYVFRPLAEYWRSQCLTLQKLFQETDQQVARQQAAAARAALEAARSQIGPFLLPLLNRQMKKVELAEQQEAAAAARAEAERQRAEQQAHAAAVQTDLEAVRALLPHLAPLVHRYHFPQAAERAAAHAAALPTAEGRAAGGQLAATCRHLAALHRFIIARLTAARPQPFRASELGGSGIVTAADAEGLQIAFGDAGSITRPWRQISPALYLRMADYSLKDRAAAGDAYGRYLLALAFYSREVNELPLARHLAAEAVQADAGLQPAAQLLFPPPAAETNAPPAAAKPPATNTVPPATNAAPAATNAPRFQPVHLKK